MSENKFTKPPWVPSGKGFQVLGNDCKTSVCQSNMPVQQMYEQIANSRLIAAAPDLLEACEGIIEQLTSGFPIRIVPGIEPYSIKKVREAIAKAKGENV